MSFALPGELIARIAFWIDDTADILAFRLVCRQFRLHSLAAFGAACFGMITCDFSKTSMTRIAKIAEIAGLHRSIRRLRFDLSPSAREENDDFHWPRDQSGRVEEVPEEVNSLRDILSRKWTNCTSIELSDAEHQHQLHTLARINSTLTPTDVLAIVLDIIDKGQLSVASLSLKLDQRVAPIAYDELQPNKFEWEPFQGLWGSSLRHLDLAWQLHMDDFAFAIVRLIKRAVNLQHLALRFRYSAATDKFLTHMTSQLADKTPRLAALKISKTGLIQPTTLLRFLALFTETLCSLALYRVKSNDWSSVIRKLQNHSEIRCLTLTHCYDGIVLGPYSLLWGRVFFCSLRDLSKTPLLQGSLELTDLSWRRKRCRAAGFRYQGHGLQEALGTISDAVYCLHHNGPPSPGLPGKLSLDRTATLVAKLPRTALDPFDWG